MYTDTVCPRNNMLEGTEANGRSPLVSCGCPQSANQTIKKQTPKSSWGASHVWGRYRYCQSATDHLVSYCMRYQLLLLCLVIMYGVPNFRSVGRFFVFWPIAGFSSLKIAQALESWSEIPWLSPVRRWTIRLFFQPSITHSKWSLFSSHVFLWVSVWTGYLIRRWRLRRRQRL